MPYRIPRAIRVIEAAKQFVTEHREQKLSALQQAELLQLAGELARLHLCCNYECPGSKLNTLQIPCDIDPLVVHLHDAWVKAMDDLKSRVLKGGWGWVNIPDDLMVDGWLAVQGWRDLDRDDDWPRIRFYACELFGHADFNLQTWGRLEDWVWVHHQMKKEDLFGCKRTVVADWLKDARDKAPTTQPNPKPTGALVHSQFETAPGGFRYKGGKTRNLVGQPRTMLQELLAAVDLRCRADYPAAVICPGGVDKTNSPREAGQTHQIPRKLLESS